MVPSEVKKALWGNQGERGKVGGRTCGIGGVDVVDAGKFSGSIGGARSKLEIGAW